MNLKPPRMFLFNGYIIFHSEEEMKILKEVDKEAYEEYLKCEVTNDNPKL